MKNWYEFLNPSSQKEASIAIPVSGMDAFLQGMPTVETELDAIAWNRQASITPDAEKVKVASLHDLQGFSRIASDVLIRKSEKDLWKLAENEEGEMYIERLYDDNGEPLKA